MPGKKKKKFIDKKNAVTFRLIHRSQKDPLQADENAPQRVLIAATEAENVQARQEEQRKFGVFYEDDYDYMQHLKDVNELYAVEPDDDFNKIQIPALVEHQEPVFQHSKEPTLQLPSSVFGSTVETDIGLLNKAAPLRGPQLDWDPDIVAALDDDFDYDDPENQLEDDFVMQANTGNEACEGEEGESDEEGDVASDEADQVSETGSDFGSFGEQSFEELETKTRFTNYSMSSSVIKRNEGLTLLDCRFEKIYEQYDDEEIGALDQDDITGYVNTGNELLGAAMEEFEKKQKEKETKLKDGVQPADEEVEIESGSESEEKEELEILSAEEPQEKWDCESILTTYSTLYNHPELIKVPKKVRPIRLTKRAGIPVDVLEDRGLNRKQIEALNRENQSEERLPPVTYRPKDETHEERKARKQAIKEERKTRRQEKKANKVAFKAEKIRQDKEVLNMKINLQGMKID